MPPVPDGQLEGNTGFLSDHGIFMSALTAAIDSGCPDQVDVLIHILGGRAAHDFSSSLDQLLSEISEGETDGRHPRVVRVCSSLSVGCKALARSCHCALSSWALEPVSLGLQSFWAVGIVKCAKIRGDAGPEDWVLRGEGNGFAWGYQDAAGLLAKTVIAMSLLRDAMQSGRCLHACGKELSGHAVGQFARRVAYLALAQGLHVAAETIHSFFPLDLVDDALPPQFNCVDAGVGGPLVPYGNSILWYLLKDTVGSGDAVSDRHMCILTFLSAVLESHRKAREIFPRMAIPACHDPKYEGDHGASMMLTPLTFGAGEYLTEPILSIMLKYNVMLGYDTFGSRYPYAVDYLGTHGKVPEGVLSMLTHVTAGGEALFTKSPRSVARHFATRLDWFPVDRSGQSLLHHAASRGLSDLFALVNGALMKGIVPLERSAVMDIRDADGYAAIHHCANPEVLKALLHHFDFDIDCPAMVRPGHLCCDHQSLEESRGCNLGMTPLHLASARGHTDMVIHLLELGANSNAYSMCTWPSASRDSLTGKWFGHTPLSLAASVEVATRLAPLRRAHPMDQHTDSEPRPTVLGAGLELFHTALRGHTILFTLFFNLRLNEVISCLPELMAIARPHEHIMRLLRPMYTHLRRKNALFQCILKGRLSQAHDLISAGWGPIPDEGTVALSEEMWPHCLLCKQGPPNITVTACCALVLGMFRTGLGGRQDVPSLVTSCWDTERAPACEHDRTGDPIRVAARLGMAEVLDYLISKERRRDASYVYRLEKIFVEYVTTPCGPLWGAELRRRGFADSSVLSAWEHRWDQNSPNPARHVVVDVLAHHGLSVRTFLSDVARFHPEDPRMRACLLKPLYMMANSVPCVQLLCTHLDCCIARLPRDLLEWIAEFLAGPPLKYRLAMLAEHLN